MPGGVKKMTLLLRRPLCSQLTEWRYRRQRAMACARVILLVRDGFSSDVWMILSSETGGVVAFGTSLGLLLEESIAFNHPGRRSIQDIPVCRIALVCSVVPSRVASFLIRSMIVILQWDDFGLLSIS